MQLGMITVLVILFLPVSGDNGSLTPLHKAAAAGDLQTVKRLLRENHDPDIMDHMQHTPLMLAARDGHEEVVRLLLRRKAEVDHQNYLGETALMLAIQHDHVLVVKTLLKRQASVHLRDAKGWTALMLSRSAAVTSLLLRKGAEVNYQVPDRGTTPLMVAAEEGLQEVVELLLEYGGNATLSDRDGRLAIDFSRRRGHQGVTDMLKDIETEK